MSKMIIGMLVGGVIGAIPSLITVWLNNRSEERRHLQGLAFNIALENWRQAKTAWMKAPPGSELEPLEVFIFHMLKIAEIAARRKITPDELEASMAEVYEITRVASRCVDRFTKEQLKEQADRKQNERGKEDV